MYFWFSYKYVADSRAYVRYVQEHVYITFVMG